MHLLHGCLATSDRVPLFETSELIAPECIWLVEVGEIA
jgi:hypothetical protein